MGGYGGEGNNEFGIGLRDVKTSGERIRNPERYQQSHTQWSKQYLSERVFGIAASFALVGLSIVWFMQVPGWVRYGFTTICCVLFLYFFFVSIYRRKRIQKLRKMHLHELAEAQKKPD